MSQYINILRFCDHPKLLGEGVSVFPKEVSFHGPLIPFVPR